MMAGPIRNVSPGSTAAVVMAKPTAPRPPNAWILYRSDKLKELPPLKPGERRAQADVSRMISSLWKSENDGTRQYYERLADEKKAEHSIKYPGYRFQPMKKEEKVALREQRKLEKEAERKARQQRGRQPQQAQAPQQLPHPFPRTTPAPQALPLPPTQQQTQIYPPMKAGSIYYPMELFGPAGPSPPISLAGSPTPDSTPESTSASDESYEARHSQPPSIVATPSSLLHSTTALPSETASNATRAPPVAPSPVSATASSSGNPYLAFLGPGSNHLVYTQSQMMLPGAVPGFASPTLPAAMPSLMPNPGSAPGTPHLQNHLHIPANQYIDLASGSSSCNPADQDAQSTGSLDLQAGTSDSTDLVGPTISSQLTYNISDPTLYDFQNAQYDQFGETELNFQVHQGFYDSVGSLMPPGSDCHNTLEAMRMGEDIFALPDFNSDLLTAHPSGEIQVDFGQFQTFDFNAYIDAGMLDSMSGSNNSFEPNDEASADFQAAPQDLYNLLNFPAPGDESPSTSSHPSMPATPAGSQVALSVDLSNTEGSQKTAYAPPSGAPYASSRRVGGSWKPPPFIGNEGSFDQTSPCNVVGMTRS